MLAVCNTVSTISKNSNAIIKKTRFRNRVTYRQKSFERMFIIKQLVMNFFEPTLIFSVDFEKRMHKL